MIDQLLCFRHLREESDFLQALDICLKEHLTLVWVTLQDCLCETFGPLQLRRGCVIFQSSDTNLVSNNSIHF